MTNDQIEKRLWSQVEFELGEGDEDLASWLMIHQGASGCQISPAGAGRIRLNATFDRKALQDAELALLKSALEEYGLAPSLASLKVKTVAEEDWLAKWKEGFEPFSVGAHFVICPPWLKKDLAKPEFAGRIALLIEPGMAFGTGLHATTRFCLQAIEEHLIGPDILDVGTGTGILAMAAHKLNAQLNMVALDNDPLAITVCRENFALNGVTDSVQLIEGTTEKVQERKFDTILSNMTCEDIVALMPEYTRLTKPKARVICAGILTEKLETLRQGISSFPFQEIAIEQGEKWTGIVLERL